MSSVEDECIVWCADACAEQAGAGDDDQYEYDEDIRTSSAHALSPDEQLLLEVLCSNRVTQMTKTYNDIEAVTRLLEEKEKDIELTARIGKDLLAYNSRLEQDVASLRNELRSASEQVIQLQHELHGKTELIRALTSDTDGSSEAGTPCDDLNPAFNKPRTVQDLELLQRRVTHLEDENKWLKKEHQNLAELGDECEQREQKLVTDIAGRLVAAESDAHALHDELERQQAENKQQHEQIMALQAALRDAEMRLYRLTEDHNQQSHILEITKETQSELTTELLDYKQRYDEVVNLLHEAQEQARLRRKRAQPSVRPGLLPWTNLAGTGDSLMSELEGSMHSELSCDSGISPGSEKHSLPQYKRVFDTVRCASRTSSGSSNLSRPYSCTSSLHLDSTGHSTDEGDTSSGEWPRYYPAQPTSGVPGCPGAADLEAALHRLTPAEIWGRRAQLQHGQPWQQSPYEPCRTPDSIMSCGSSSLHSSGMNQWRLPDKLQIVKPLEGSHTLQQWAQLATPTLGGLLDERPGVKIRGGKELQDIGLEAYALEDLEEDEEPQPCKRFESTACVYTYTTSTIMHVDDGATTGTAVCSLTSSRAPSPPPIVPSQPNTPRPGTPCRSRRNSTSTYSTTAGLAQLLNERGIRAVTPSCVSTPILGYTPTATPCNSPERPSSPTSPLKRQTALTRSERKSLAGIRIREKIERIGLDNILPDSSRSPFEPLLPTSGIYPRRASPMAQLTSLKSKSKPPLPKSAGKPPLPSRPSGDMGVPGRPGSGALNRRLEQLGGARRGVARRGSTPRAGAQHRPDLGQVATPTNANGPAQQQSALGTISSLLFGRKGGLL